MIYLIHRNREAKQGDKGVVPNKRKRQNLGKEPNKTEISNLPEKEFKVMVIKTLTELGRIMDENSENFSKEIENIKKNQSELKNTITEMKNKL